jgi:chromosome segregation ATPase
MGRIDTGPALNIHKLTNVEAQRIMLILEETFVKLSLLSYIPPGVTADDSVLPVLVGPEIHQVLREQAVLEQQYESVSSPAGIDPSRGLPDFETLDDELRHSSRVVSRMLMEDQSIVDKLEAAMGDFERDGSMLKFLGTFNELKHQTYQKMSTSVEEEKSKEDFYLEVSAREEKASQMLRALQKDLKSEKAEHEAEVHALDEAIAKLRADIDHIRSSTAAEIKNLEETTRTREDDDKRSWDSKNTSLGAELAQLRAELAATSQRNRESEEHLRKKKVKNETEVENWIRKYDEEVKDKVSQIRAISKEYDEEKKQLHWYQEYFQRVEQEKALRAAEQRKVDEERAKAESQRKLLDHAATVLQRILRGRLARKEMEKVKKAKKGKGRKGGKGKKGGKGGKGGKGKK